MALAVLGLQVVFGIHFFVAGILMVVLPRKKLWGAVDWVRELRLGVSVAVGLVELVSATGLVLATIFHLDVVAVLSGLCLAGITVAAGIVDWRRGDKAGAEFSSFSLTAMVLITGYYLLSL